MFRHLLTALFLTAALALAGGLARADSTKADESKPAKVDEPKKADADPQKQIDDLRKQVDEMRKQLDEIRRMLGTGPAPNPNPNPGAERPRPGLRPGEGRLGVYVDRPSEVLVEQLGLKKDQGLVVQEVRPDSPAAKAGLKQYDILLELGGKPIPNEVGDFTRMLADVKADSPVDLVILRKGKQETIKGVTLPEVRPVPRPGSGLQPQSNSPFFGIILVSGPCGR
jgi:membrane-associated protease RseP (regulator of RpoE activity)